MERAYKDHRGAPAWESLNATIRELTKYMEGEDSVGVSDGAKKMYQQVAELSEWWFQEGFSVAFELCKAKTSLGEDLERIEFSHSDAWLAPTVVRRVELQAPVANHPDESWGL